MAQYPEPRADRPGGCLETLVLTRVAFQVLLPALGLLFGSILALVGLFYAFFTSVWLGLLALGIVAFLVYLLALWDRRRIREAEQDPDRLGGPPRHTR